ncbi:MAG: hypothetical protein Unbinned3138contig1000_59 [Prokaryotic dsDNA virus sp.]|nr:MAG: hypothetical protein Unbinned3138contig1000_59 [Prokaryotic dsDNA virus sp.]
MIDDPTKSWLLGENIPKCKAIKSNDRAPCLNVALPGSDYCGIHAKSHDTLRKSRQRMMAKRRK